MRPYERFLNYVMFDTMSLEGQTTVPSTPGQRTLAEALVSELRGFGIEDVRLDDKGYIYGSVPSNIEKEVPWSSALLLMWISSMPIRPRQKRPALSKTMTAARLSWRLASC